MTIQIVANPKNSKLANGWFSYAYSGYKGTILKQIIGDTLAIVSVYPMDPEHVSWNQAELRVDLRTYRLLGFTMFQKDLSRKIGELEYISINQPLDPASFRFDLRNYPAGTTIIDYREETKY